MKLLTRASIATAVVLALSTTAGCSPAVNTTDEKITLTFGDWGDMGFSELFAEYEALHPNIDIVEKSSEYNAHHEGLLTALAAGTGSDINGIEGSWMPYFVQYPDKFLDLREYGAEDLASEYLDWRWLPAVAEDGSVLGIPTDVGGMAVAYRTDLFEAAGLPTDPEEVSALWSGGWDDYIATAKQYTEATGKKFADSTESVFYGMITQDPIQFYSESGDLIYESNPKILKAWDQTVAMAPYSGGASIFTPEWNASIVAGDVAAVLSPSWMLTMIKGVAPELEGKWNVAEVPLGEGNFGGSWVTISKSTAHPQEAADFVKWLLAPEQQKKIFVTKGNFPSAISALEDEAVTSYVDPYFSNAPIGKIYSASVTSLRPSVLGEKSASIETSFRNALASVAQGTATGEQAWEAVISEITKNAGPSN